VARFTALIDSSVLYSSTITAIILEVAKERTFRAMWSESIHEEWIRNGLKNRSDLTLEQLTKRRETMDASIPDCLVHGYEGIAASLKLPDPNDNHVLAAAIKGRADVIVTQNLKHFPAEDLANYDLEAQDADSFLIYQRGLNEFGFLEGVKTGPQQIKKTSSYPRSIFGWVEKGWIDSLGI
jgi:predicted nucleic acid-binding protein